MAPISRKQHILDSLSMNDNSNCSTSLHSSDSYGASTTSSSHSFCQPSLFSEQQQMLDRAQYARVNRVILDKNSDEYRKRRERNNIAVKKSRTKSKIKTIQTLQQVNLLKAENDFLSRKVDILSRELRILKDIFMSHASSAHGTRMTEYDLSVLTGSHAMDHPTHATPASFVSTYTPDCRSPEPQLYLSSSSSHRRYPASLSLSSGSSIQDSEDDM